MTTLEDGSFDPGAIESLKRAMARSPDGAERVIAKFLADAPGWVETVRAAGARQDWGVLARTAHDLKSTARLLGGRGLGQLAARIEAAAKTDRMAAEDVARLDAALAALSAALEPYRARA
ncbi:MAG: Hpt domain-containing protein [Alphaproteobacteria bacterium]|nr:Hpt domain-containing protein [Alphaproteobacteria bacterium]